MIREGEGWERRKNKDGSVRPSNLLTDFEDDDEGDDGREAHLRVVKQKNPELLGAEDEVKATQVAPKKPVEAAPEPSFEPVVESEGEVEKTEEVKVEIKETKINNGVVWYDGILDDLKIVTFPDDELSDEERDKRRETAKKMRNKGIRLPVLSVDKQDTRPYAARQQLQGAIDYLNPLFMGRYRKEAIAYLNNMGIGNGTGAEFLPGSVEDKQVERKIGVVDPAVKEHEEYVERERKVNIMNWLTALSGSRNEREKEIYLSALEDEGVKIKKFLEDMEKVAPGRSKDTMRQLRAVVEVWRMSEEKKREFPTMTKIANNYARVLGLE